MPGETEEKKPLVEQKAQHIKDKDETSGAMTMLLFLIMVVMSSMEPVISKWAVPEADAKKPWHLRPSKVSIEVCQNCTLQVCSLLERTRFVLLAGVELPLGVGHLLDPHQVHSRKGVTQKMSGLAERHEAFRDRRSFPWVESSHQTVCVVCRCEQLFDEGVVGVQRIHSKRLDRMCCTFLVLLALRPRGSEP